MLVALVGAGAALLLLPGDGTEDEVSESGLLDRAIANTENATRYGMYMDYEVEPFPSSFLAQVDGETVLVESDGSWDTTLKVGELHLTFEDGVWREDPPRSESVDPNEDMHATLQILRSAQVREVGRTDGRSTFEATCPSDAGSAQTSVGHFCAGDPDGTVTVAVDEASEKVLWVRLEGDFEVYPGRFERGTVEFGITEPSREPIDIPSSDSIDRSGVVCLAEALGVDPTSRAVTAAIQDHTTEQLRELYTERCDFESWPPGVDLDHG